MKREVKVGGFYRHYKGKEYRVTGTVHHSETLEEMVLYDCLYENEIGKAWVRPIEMFLSKVTIDNETKDRFELID